MRPAELINANDIRWDGRKGPDKHTKTRSMGGNEDPENSQWRAQCKLSKWELNSLQQQEENPVLEGQCQMKCTDSPVQKNF